MRRFPPPDDLPQWMLDGTVYGCEAEYVAALDKRNDRRARLLARLSVEAGELLTDPAVVAVEAVRRYCELLAPFWSAERGWSDPWWFGEREWSDVDVPDGLEGRR